jgi:hypothetical protein
MESRCVAQLADGVEVVVGLEEVEAPSTHGCMRQVICVSGLDQYDDWLQRHKRRTSECVWIEVDGWSGGVVSRCKRYQKKQSSGVRLVVECLVSATDEMAVARGGYSLGRQQLAVTEGATLATAATLEADAIS